MPSIQHVTRIPGYYISADFAKTYVAEAKAISSKDELAAHILRWQHMLYWENKRLFTGEYNIDELWECIVTYRGKGHCKHFLDFVRAKPQVSETQALETRILETQCGLDVLLPGVLLMTAILARRYGVPDFTAFHQKFCRDPEHLGCY